MNYTWSLNISSNFTIKDYLLGGVKVAKNADPDSYVYTIYGMDSIRVQNFHYLTVEWVKMSLLFI